MSSWSRSYFCLLTLFAPACCIAGSARIRTPQGERAANSLQIGDQLLSLDLATGRPLAGTILQIRRAVRECLTLRWRGGALVCTPDHPLYAPDRGEYRPASDWVTGDLRRLLVLIDETVEIVDLESVQAFAGVHEVVDLTLAAEPRNFVADGVVVHNKSLRVPGDGGPDYTQASEDHPAFTLSKPGDTRQFRLRACIDGDDVASGSFLLEADTSTPVELGPDDRLWLAFWSSVAPDKDRAAAVPDGYVLLSENLPERSCQDGVVLTFEHLQGPADTPIIVALHVSVTAELDDTVDLLEVSLEPEE